jgi:mitogen-activated protein kinase kinase kinase
MSYMTELRSKRDRSDTASLLTVDEITAEVESRQESSVNTAVDQGSDSEDWTKVGVSETETDEETEATYNEVEEGGDVLDEDETTLNDGEEDELGGKVKIRKGV